MDPNKQVVAAGVLAQAKACARPVPRLTSQFASLDIWDSYMIQGHNIDQRVRSGAVVRGHKADFHPNPLQCLENHDEPSYGHLLSDMFVSEDSSIRVDSLCAPRVQVQVAFVLGQSLPGPGCTVADVLRCTEYVCPALEVIDSRIENWDGTVVDTVADNASSGLVVLGGQRASLEGLNLRTIGATLRRNYQLIATGASGAVLGNPATSVAWLANKIGAFGVRLEAGHIILPGPCTRAFDVKAGQIVRADLDQLGSVSAVFT